MSLWSLLAAPLLLSCDLPKLDEFTLSLLTNDEVLEVNQDALGTPARTVACMKKWFKPVTAQILARPLEDGAMAVGLFNRTTVPAKLTVTWADLKCHGPQIVRDLWRQADLGNFDHQFTAEVAGHGVSLVKIIPKK
jgi:alpha-galactosidase